MSGGSVETRWVAAVAGGSHPNPIISPAGIIDDYRAAYERANTQGSQRLERTLSIALADIILQCTPGVAARVLFELAPVMGERARRLLCRQLGERTGTNYD